MNPLLEMNDLSLKLGDFTLGPLSLSLAPGDYLVLLGPSGCGKTSLLRTVAGVYPIASGRVRMDGCDVGHLPPQKRSVGYVAQTANLFPHLNVAKNVAFGLAYLSLSSKEKQRRFERMVSLLGLQDFLERRPATLSGGESRRVALARSLVVNPRVLLLDEPLSMLDHNARTNMLDILMMIHDELGTATIHVTHDREEAWALNQRCAVMRQGRIEQSGSVNELFRQPNTRFVAEFLSGSNVFRARFERRGTRWVAVLDWAEFDLAGAVDFEEGFLQIRPESFLISPQQDTGTLRGVIRSLADRGIYSEILVEVANGNVLRVHTPTAGAADLQVGNSISLKCATPPHAIER